MSRTIKDLKEFTRRIYGSSNVVVNVSGTELEVESMSIVRTEGFGDCVVLYTSYPASDGYECEEM